MQTQDCILLPTWIFGQNNGLLRTQNLRICTSSPYTIQHETVPILFPVILRTIITAYMLSTGEEGRKSTHILSVVQHRKINSYPSYNCCTLSTVDTWIIISANIYKYAGNYNYKNVSHVFFHGIQQWFTHIGHGNPLSTMQTEHFQHNSYYPAINTDQHTVDKHNPQT